MINLRASINSLGNRVEVSLPLLKIFLISVYIFLLKSPNELIKKLF